MKIPRKSSVSFIVPALNEESAIPDTILSIFLATQESGIDDFEILLINDGSTDSTGKVMDSLSLRYNNIRVLHNSTNLGIGSSYVKGVSAARCEYIMFVAGDNAASPSSISQTITLLGEYDILLPYIANPEIRPWIRRFGSQAYTFVLNTIFRLKIKYYNGAVVRRNCMDSIDVSSRGYTIHSEVVLKLIYSGWTYQEFGVIHLPSPNTHSSALRLKNLINVFLSIFKITKSILISPKSKPLFQED
jgi:glycosyltransferase involved in cell wall biosynthesis